MGKALILTEKPSVARDFAKALSIGNVKKKYFENERYVICWAFGHLLRPYNPDDYNISYKKWNLRDLPILPEKLLYLPEKSNRDHLNLLVELFSRNDIDQVIVATDAGREGEVIARTILGHCKTKQEAYRFWTSEALTEDVISSQLAHLKPLKEYDNLFIAGKARQFADWLVGMNLSRLATLKLGDLFSVGRVQTAVLGLLVDRRKSIDSFVSTPFWTIQFESDFQNHLFKFFWFNPNVVEENRQRIMDEDSVKRIIKIIEDGSPVVSESKIEDLKHPSPYLYSLTELQRDANRLFGYSAKQTLEIAQRLYESKKCLSYPRTDSQFLGVSSFPLVEKVMTMVNEHYRDLCGCLDPDKLSTLNTNVFDDSKLTDHHALIPLAPYRGNATDERNIYRLVMARFLEAFSIDAVSTDVYMTAMIGNENFRCKERVWSKLGWKSIQGNDKEQLFSATLPRPGEQLTVSSTKSTQSKTLPPYEYTESGLLKDMANPARLVDDRDQKNIFRTHIGLGTQSTRAQIIETLIDRGYVKRIERKLIAQQKGVYLIDQMRKIEVLKQMTLASETAIWELELDQVAKGQANGLSFINKIKSFVSNSIKAWH